MDGFANSTKQIKNDLPLRKNIFKEMFFTCLTIYPVKALKLNLEIPE